MSFESVLSVRHLQSFLTRKKNNFFYKVTRALMINVLECTNSTSKIKCSIKAKKQTMTNELKYMFKQLFSHCKLFQSNCTNNSITIITIPSSKPKAIVEGVRGLLKMFIGRSISWDSF